MRRSLESAVEPGQYASNRLDDAGALAWIGTVGDSHDNAMAESVIGLYKAECGQQALPEQLALH